MKKIVTTNPQTFVFFMNQHKPTYVACSRDGSEPERPYYSRERFIDLFRAWFFFMDNADEQCLCELRLRESCSYSFDSKADLIQGLRDLKVSEDDIAHLKQMSVKKIIAVTMMDINDDATTVSCDESTVRVRWEFTVGLRKIKIIPDLESKTQLKARAEIDYSAEVDWLYGEVKIGLPEGSYLAENCTLEFRNTND